MLSLSEGAPPEPAASADTLLSPLAAASEVSEPSLVALSTPALSPPPFLPSPFSPAPPWSVPLAAFGCFTGTSTILEGYLNMTSALSSTLHTGSHSVRTSGPVRLAVGGARRYVHAPPRNGIGLRPSHAPSDVRRGRGCGSRSWYFGPHLHIFQVRHMRKVLLRKPATVAIAAEAEQEQRVAACVARVSAKWAPKHHDAGDVLPDRCRQTS